MDTVISPTMAAAFEAWRASYIAWMDATETCDIDDTVQHALHGARFFGLMQTRVQQLGDLIVKLYVEILEQHGHEPGGSIFAVSTREFCDDGTQDTAFWHGIYADLQSCDLGQRLLSNGSIAA
ncbi:hypothetical protein [Novosphingobium sp. 9]|uniref:hypothetical protein n=1 Tax=Novosphingobium sp. 9 TaxID=2025349 RepID=UPI0021B6AD54|nr:hypothetical protein [Novosphingobium sp. 9]